MGRVAFLLIVLALGGAADANTPQSDAVQQAKASHGVRFNTPPIETPPVEIAVEPFGEWLSGGTARMLVTIRNTSDDRLLLSIPERWVPEFEYSVLHPPRFRGGEGGGSLSGGFHDKKTYCGTSVETVLGLPPRGSAYRIVEVDLPRLSPGLIAAKLHFLLARLDRTLNCNAAVKLETEAKTQVRISPAGKAR